MISELLTDNAETSKLIYDQIYPAGHDWAVHFEPKIEHDMRTTMYMAFVVAYTSPNSLHGREIVVCSDTSDTKEKALQYLVGFLSGQVVHFLDGWR